ncbi:hemolymph lipopolysaccharide-binding protein-like [Chrysoperla carnea]|uniref:hemolymph lipopolysaccharide-binding protein-like n=1 Tax=Chrysoperla carnea TaxID=189513 RepID=UPI001D0947E5|nr:hemolymph lipopolysaccharide-binding protein-like [Chrysoperla carnea]
MHFLEVLIIFVLSVLNVHLTKAIMTDFYLWDYVKFEDSYYRFHRQARLWQDARQVCEDAESHLAIINSKEEESFIKSLYKRSSGAEVENYTFVGYHNYFRREEWVTIDGKSMRKMEYDPWAPNQPFYSDDTEFEKRCGALSFKGLYNFPCFYRLPFVCENEVSTYKDGIQFKSSKKEIETAKTYKTRADHKH